MKPGDMVKLYGVARCALWDISSNHVEHDPGTTGQIINGELCLVLETVEKCHGKKWLRIVSSRSGITGWVLEELMDEVVL